jgi:hypothetical protein
MYKECVWNFSNQHNPSVITQSSIAAYLVAVLLFEIVMVQKIQVISFREHNDAMENITIT